MSLTQIIQCPKCGHSHGADSPCVTQCIDCGTAPAATVARYSAPAPAALRHVTERDIALIERQAAILAKSSVVPLDNAADIAMIGMKALALGIEPMAAFDDIYAIESKNKAGQVTRRSVTLSARLRVALARRSGCEVWFDESTDTQATCCLRRPSEKRVHRLTYTLAQARTAGLVGTYSDGRPLKDNWAKHPAAMLRAAAARQLINMAAQDVLLGVGGMGDVDLDTAEIDDLDLPEETVGHSETLDTASAAIVYASADDWSALKARIADLDTVQKEWLRGRAKAADLSATGGFPKADKLQAAHVEAWSELIDVAEEMIAEAETEGDGGAERHESLFDGDDPARPFD